MELIQYKISVDAKIMPVIKCPEILTYSPDIRITFTCTAGVF